MNKLFQPDNPVIRFLSCFCDLMLTNALFIICSIPVVTIGASVTAMYHVMFQLQAGTESYIHKMFFDAFKSNFRQASCIWIPFLLLTAFFTGDLYIIYHVIDASFSFIQFPVWFLLIMTFCIQLYAFPILARFDSGMRRLLLNSVLLSIGNFPTTVFFTVVPVGILYFSAQTGKRMVITGSILLFFGFAAFAYIYALFLNRIFRRCMPEEETNTENKTDASFHTMQ